MPKLNLINQSGFNAILLLIVLGVILAGAGIWFFSTQQKIPTKSNNQATTVIKKVGIIQAAGMVLYDIPNGFKDEMKKLGYVEGQNISYEYVDWNEDITKADPSVKLMLDKNVDLLLSISEVGVFSAFKQFKERGKETPIVFALVEEPVKSGLVKSYKSSGNSATGVVTVTAESVSKQLEFLKRIKPDAKKVGYFGEGFHAPANNPGTYYVDALKQEAPKFGLTLVEYKTKTFPGPAQEADFKKISDAIKPGEIDALVHIPGHYISDLQKREIAVANRLKIITIEPASSEVLDGGLYSYSFDLFDLGRQSAILADKILKGTAPTDIPIEFAHKNSLTVNLKTAKEIGITIPQDVLDLADKKIE